MGVKQDSAGGCRRINEPVEVIRQFAWHLAGSLAAEPAGQERQAIRRSASKAGRPPKASGRR